MKPSAVLAERLSEAERNGRRRQLRPRLGLDFSSNDYLDFSEDPALRDRALRLVADLPLGSSGSRLLRGNLALHEAVESRLARFCGRESALLFPSGYQANLGLLSALLTAKDLVFSDRLNHASLVDGIRLSRARKEIFPHNDLDALERRLMETDAQGGFRVIVTESVFSMEGDFAPLPELAGLAKKHEALLVVDESHATGLYGDFDRGLGGGRVQALGLTGEVFATIHTGGKALGAAGAWICGPALLHDSLVGFSRAFIYSTAVAPWLAALLDSAVEHWGEVGPTRAGEALARAELLRATLARLGLPPTLASPAAHGPIQPILIGENERALEASRRLEKAGFDVRAIRPPTVPEGTARLRVTLSSRHTPEQVLDLARAISREFARATTA